MTFEIEKEIPITDEDKEYLVKIFDGLFEEYAQDLNDEDQDEWYGTDRGLFNDAVSPFMDWLEGRLENAEE